MSRRGILTSLAIVAVTALTFAYQMLSPRTTSFEASTISSAKSELLVQIGSQQFTAELARTETEKATGLSNRTSLQPNQGMLFVFDQPTRPSFWMRQMLFDLDIIWIDQQLTIVEITRNVPAPKPGQTDEQLPQYQPKSDVLYVLEVPAGAAVLLGQGEKVNINDLKSL